MLADDREGIKRMALRLRHWDTIKYDKATTEMKEETMKSLIAPGAFLLVVLATGCGSQQAGDKAQLGRVCLKADGRHYGIPDTRKCASTDKQVSTRPSAGVLGLQAESAINFDTAKRQENAKTLAEVARKRAHDEAILANKRAEDDAIRRHEEALKAAAETRRIQPAVDAYIRGRTKENASHEEAVGYAAEALESQFGGHSYENWKQAREYIAPKLLKYDTPEWEEKLKANRRPVDIILETLTEVRKEATKRIVADRNLQWSSESDPKRIYVVGELKKVIGEEVRKLNGTLSPHDIDYLRDQLNKQIDSNL